MWVWARGTGAQGLPKGKAGSGRESRAKPVEGKVWHRAGANDGDSHLSSGKTSVMSKNLILVSKKAE